MLFFWQSSKNRTAELGCICSIETRSEHTDRQDNKESESSAPTLLIYLIDLKLQFYLIVQEATQIGK